MGNIITDLHDIAEELNRRLMSAPIVETLYGEGIKRPVPVMVCADGFSVSIQAHRGAYCQPRDNYGPWRMFELGFPNAPMPELADRCDGYEGDAAKTATETVWGYVPVERIATLLAGHGGLVSEWSVEHAVS